MQGGVKHNSFPLPGMKEPVFLVEPRWNPNEKGTHRFFCKRLIYLVRPTRIELVAYCLGGNRSILLSYERIRLLKIHMAFIE